MPVPKKKTRKETTEMNMKMILALAAVAVATVAGASTNYVEVAAKNRNLCTTIRAMEGDPGLADPAAFRATLEAVDEAMSTGGVIRAYQCVSRRCPLTARAVLAGTECFSERARKDILAVCGYEAANRPLGLTAKEAGFVEFARETACSGLQPPANARNAILNAAIVPVRRTIRAEGGSFVGKDGAKLVKDRLDALAAELNAPRFGKAGKLLAEIGLDVEWEFIQSRILADAELDGLKTRLMGGEIPFEGTLQNKLCVALGVEAYNAFVKEYNGK